jgi:hypothetical protein
VGATKGGRWEVIEDHLESSRGGEVGNNDEK